MVFLEKSYHNELLGEQVTVRLKQGRYKETGYVKYLTDEEFSKIKWYVENKIQSPPTQMCIRLMMVMGLRVGEAVQLNLKNFTENFAKLIYVMFKSKRTQERILPDFFQKELQEYYFKYGELFREGYMFFPWGNNAKTKHISRVCIARQFSLMRKALRLEEIYHHRAVQSDGIIRPLYRISPHTLRHYCCWKYYKASGNDLVFTQRTIGHKKIETTCHYIHSLLSKNQEKNIIENAFAPKIA